MIKERAVRKLIGSTKPGMLLLQETKLKEVKRRLDRLLWGTASVCSEWVIAEGLSGGIDIIWGSDFFSCTDKAVDRKYIVMKGQLKQANLEIVVGNIYAPNDDVERKQVWEELLSLKERWDLPWCLGADFNVTKNSDERLRSTGSVSAMREFCDFIENMQLIDMPLVGGKFTWSNNRNDPVMCRLDRFLLSSILVENFPTLYQEVLARSISDHNPVRLVVDAVDWGPKPCWFLTIGWTFRGSIKWCRRNGKRYLVLEVMQ